MKPTREEVSIIYDRLYNIMDGLVKKFDPCQFKDGVCMAGRKNGCCEIPEGAYGGPKICPRHSAIKGCVAKPLTCRAYLCLAAANTPRGMAFIAEVRPLNIYWPFDISFRGGFGAGKGAHIEDALSYSRWPIHCHRFPLVWPSSTEKDGVANHENSHRHDTSEIQR